MKFTILVGAAPYQSQGVDSALQFARALLEQGHSLTRVFFYHDGVNTATRLASPPQDDRDLNAGWRELADAHGIDLVVCVAAAQRRGIVDASERERHGKDADNLAEGYRIAGLGQLLDAALDADRFVQFG